MTNRKLVSLIKVLKANGVKHYRSPELSLEIDLNHSPQALQEALEPIKDKLSTYTEDDTLFWSSNLATKDAEDNG